MSEQSSAASIPAKPSMATCRHCLSDLIPGASICTVCQQHQRRWRSSIARASELATTISLVGAALTYIVTTLPEVRKLVAWEESVSVLQFSTRKGLSIANVGDGVVHISHVNLEARHPTGKSLFTRTIQIDKDLERRKFMFSSGEDAKLNGMSLGIAGHGSLDDFTKSLDDAGDVSKVLAGKKCFLFVVYKSDSPLLNNYRKSMGPRLVTFPVKAELSYYSFGMNKHFTQAFEVTGVLHESSHTKCTAQHAAR